MEALGPRSAEQIRVPPPPYSGAAGEVLAHVFPDDAKMWRARAAEAGMSRLWGGVHWRIDVEQGLKMGRQVGGLVVDRAERDGAEA